MNPTALVPHRAPILCLDRFLSVAPERAEAEGLVREGAHAPAGALWEGGLIEGLAQTAAALRGGAGAAVLTGLHELELRRSPRVGERVRYVVSLGRVLPPRAFVIGEAWVGEELVARGELSFFFAPEAAA